MRATILRRFLPVVLAAGLAGAVASPAEAAVTTAANPAVSISAKATVSPVAKASKSSAKAKAAAKARAAKAAAAKAAKAKAAAAAKAKAKAAAAAKAKAAAAKAAKARAAAQAKAAAKAKAAAQANSGWSMKIGSWSRNIVAGGQAEIDRCQAVVAWTPDQEFASRANPWLAGHNTCGFNFWSGLAMGTKITINKHGVTSTYVVNNRKVIGAKQASVDASSVLSNDLVLQTCGANNTIVLTYAAKVG